MEKSEIKLTETEIVILENLDNRYRFIARDEDGVLCIYENKPLKDDVFWFHIGSELQNLPFPNLFQFIKWEDEEPYKIEELLKNDK